MGFSVCGFRCDSGAVVFLSQGTVTAESDRFGAPGWGLTPGGCPGRQKKTPRVGVVRIFQQVG